MKIVHVVRQYAPSVGGLEDAVRLLCLHLARMPENDVRIVTLDRLFRAPLEKLPARETSDGIEIVRIPFFGSRRYPIAPSVLFALKDADLVHVHAVDFFFDFLAWTKFLHKKPLVASTHGGFFHTSFAARLKRIYFSTVTRFSCRFYEKILASSENDARTFRPVAESKVETIENGVNIEKWCDAGSRTPRRAMLFIGRFSENKRLHLLVALAGELAKLHPDWRLIIAGRADALTRNDLLELARTAQASNAVLVRQNPDDGEIASLIGQASYIASASSYEGFGLSVVEGLSAGLVPVLSPIAPFDKLLSALGFGHRLSENDIKGSARAIEETHADPETDHAARRARCMDIAASYAWPDTAKRVFAAYQRVLAS